MKKSVVEKVFEKLKEINSRDAKELLKNSDIPKKEMILEMFEDLNAGGGPDILIKEVKNNKDMENKLNDLFINPYNVKDNYVVYFTNNPIVGYLSSLNILEDYDDVAFKTLKDLINDNEKIKGSREAFKDLSETCTICPISSINMLNYHINILNKIRKILIDLTDEELDEIDIASAKGNGNFSTLYYDKINSPADLKKVLKDNGDISVSYVKVDVFGNVMEEYLETEEDADLLKFIKEVLLKAVEYNGCSYARPINDLIRIRLISLFKSNNDSIYTMVAGRIISPIILFCTKLYEKIPYKSEEKFSITILEVFNQIVCNETLLFAILAAFQTGKTESLVENIVNDENFRDTTSFTGYVTSSSLSGLGYSYLVDLDMSLLLNIVYSIYDNTIKMKKDPMFHLLSN